MRPDESMEVTAMPLRGGSGVVRYGLPGLLLGVTLVGGIGGGRGLWADVPSGNRPAASAAATGDPSGMIAFTTALPGSTGGSAQLLYLIDSKSRAFAIYRVDPGQPRGTVKLEAARQYQWDLKLSQYNNQAPEVAAIESMVKAPGALK